MKSTIDSDYDFQLGGGGAGSRSTRTGRQRAGATAAGGRGAGRGFTSIDRRVRTNAVRAARASVGARTQRARVRTR